MAKVKNIGQSEYHGAISVPAGEVVEVSAEQSAYLCSDECPGSFEAVVEAKADPKAKK